MLTTFKYRPADTFIHHLDPRTLIISMICLVSSVIQIWDLRLVLVFLVIGVAEILVARLRWADMRRFWLLILFIGTMLSLMTFFTGRGMAGVYEDVHIIWQPAPLIMPVLKMTIAPSLSLERLVFLVTQIARFICFASLSVIIPYVINPALYGVTFRQLGLPDKIAYAMELAFRFIPSLGRDFQMILDAQRARGFEFEGGRHKGLITRIRNFAPLMIPLTIGSILKAEIIIDAMDLRGFGIGPRTWLPVLKYRPLDRLINFLSILTLMATTTLNILGFIRFWVPPIFS